MQRVRNSRGQRTYGQRPTASTSRRNLLLRCNALQQENKELKETLWKEQAYSLRQDDTILELHHELEETTKRWQKQKSLREMYMKREKETRRALEQLIRYSDGKPISPKKMVSLLRESARQKEPHSISQEKLTVELQSEKEKTKHLQEELERLKVSRLEENKRFETELMSVRQQVDTLQRELDQQIQQKDILQKCYEELQASFKLSQDTFVSELEVVKVSYHVKYETELSKVQQQAATLQNELQQDVQQKTLHQSQPDKEVQLCVINDLKAEQQAQCQQTSKERSILQQDISEKERLFEREMEELITPFQQMTLTGGSASKNNLQVHAARVHF